MELSPMISEFLFYEDDANVTEKSHYIGLKIEIRELLKDDFNRKILTEILLDLRKDVSGDTQKKLFELYTDLGLEQDAFAKLESWRWEIISKGILELTLMEVEEAYTFIVKFINSSRSTIRKQAEIAAVTLKHEGINYFLDTTKYKISEWQQLKILDVLRNKKDFNPPRFRAWLTSTNKHVVLFALRLIEFYNQNDANTTVIELVKHKDQQVRRQAIDCIKEFYVVAALPTLKGVFWKCTVDTKIAILGAIAELGGESDIEFLKTVSQREGNFSVKSKAIGAINTISPESVMPTENIEHVTEYVLPVPNTDSQIADDTVVKAIGEISHAEEPTDTHHEVESDELINSNQTNNPSQNPVLMLEKTQNDEALRNIEVSSEEVKYQSSEQDHSLDTVRFDISEINFLPIVTEETSDPAERPVRKELKNQNENTLQNSEPETKQLSEPMEDELRALIDEIRELDFLPVVIDEQPCIAKEGQPDHNTDTPEPLKTIEGYSLPDLEVRFEKAMTQADSYQEEIPEFDLEEAPVTNIDEGQDEDALSWLLANNELRDVECTYETVTYSFDAEVSNHLIPEPIYYDDHETYMISLLDDLEEMGDQREIPLLQELMAEEPKRFIKDRISGMIEKFARQVTVKSKTHTINEQKIELPVFSVFADLFKNIDMESKLILLDEVIHVGDEKEIEFLDGLLEHPNENIRKKAQTVLQILIAKLSHERPEALYSSGVSAIVSEYIEPVQVDTAAETAEYENLLSKMDISPSLAPEILDINFELNEILDHTYDQKILDIQVISTEVSPNEYGGSFFNSLRNFSKLF